MNTIDLTELTISAEPFIHPESRVGSSGRPLANQPGTGRRSQPRTVSMTAEECALYDELHERLGIGITEAVRTVLTPRVRAALDIARQLDMSPES
jgi:hypothetical protein